MKTIAQIISVLFHPLLMPANGVLFLINSNSYLSLLNIEQKWKILLIIVFGTFILPVAFIPIYIYRNLILNVNMNERRERIFPMLITSICYYITYYFFSEIAVASIITTFLLACFTAILVCLLITWYWKISTHACGIGGVVGLLVAAYLKINADIGLFLIISILLAGIIGSARLLLNTHTPSQVYSGFILGVLTSLVIIFIG